MAPAKTSRRKNRRRLMRRSNLGLTVKKTLPLAALAFYSKLLLPPKRVNRAFERSEGLLLSARNPERVRFAPLRFPYPFVKW
jgi:hypothetical protein